MTLCSTLFITYLTTSSTQQTVTNDCVEAHICLLSEKETN